MMTNLPDLEAVEVDRFIVLLPLLVAKVEDIETTDEVAEMIDIIMITVIVVIIVQPIEGEKVEGIITTAVEISHVVGVIGWNIRLLMKRVRRKNLPKSQGRWTGLRLILLSWPRLVVLKFRMGKCVW